MRSSFLAFFAAACVLAAYAVPLGERGSVSPYNAAAHQAEPYGQRDSTPPSWRDVTPMSSSIFAAREGWPTESVLFHAGHSKAPASPTLSTPDATESTPTQAAPTGDAPGWKMRAAESTPRP
ncbi:hypothetical protein GGX14DRAFT_480766 [Mycena pura]|uniref:Uncharacterized protein n=1 Tax=Mycena pura TaxID=153505 RepID=A0AAD6UPG4_9AGAR|nr:hypothetical protein GGX14DRAFT_480766 [Mycena pura]